MLSGSAFGLHWQNGVTVTDTARLRHTVPALLQTLILGVLFGLIYYLLLITDPTQYNKRLTCRRQIKCKRFC